MLSILHKSSLIGATLLVVGLLGVPSRALGDSTTSSQLRSQRRAIARAAIRDRDHDGLPAVIEGALGTSARRADSDGDGIWDGDELAVGLGMTNLKAYNAGKFDDDDEDRHEDERDLEDDDSDDDEEDRHPIKRPTTCGERITRNCRAPVCSKGRRGGKHKKGKKCRPDSKKPIATPTGTPQPTAVPNPTSVPGSGSFDANGNTTKFGIPAGMVGTIATGTSLWTSNCSNCHRSDKRNRTFSQVKASFSISAMTNIRMSDGQIAHIVAYLNRFQP